MIIQFKGEAETVQHYEELIKGVMESSPRDDMLDVGAGFDICVSGSGVSDVKINCEK